MLRIANPTPALSVALADVPGIILPEEETTDPILDLFVERYLAIMDGDWQRDDELRARAQALIDALPGSEWQDERNSRPFPY